MILSGVVLGVALLASSMGVHASDHVDAVDCRHAANEFLSGWEEFAASGELSFVSPYLAESGPQYNLFEREAALLAEAGRDIEFTMSNAAPADRSASGRTVVAEVQVSSVGHVTEVFDWEFEFIADSDCVLWTVVDSAPRVSPDPRPEPEASPAPRGPERAEAAVQAPIGEPTGRSQQTATGTVRLPAVAAWVIVFTLVGVATAGYLAPRFDRREPR